MYRPPRKRLLKIGIIMVVASVLLFSLSVYLVESSVTSASNVSIASGSSYSLTKSGISSGDDIEYSVSSAGNRINVTAYIQFQSGAREGYLNISDSYQGSMVIVSHYTGNVSLVVVNSGSATIVVDLSVGSVGYYTLLSTVFGFVLLPSGIALLGVYYYSRAMEKRRERLRGFSR